MDFRAHTVTALLVFSGAITFFGAYIVANRVALHPTAQENGWTSGIVVSNPVANTVVQPPETQIPSAARDYAYISTLASTSRPNVEGSQTAATFDWDAFQKSLSTSQNRPATTQPDTPSEAYSFIPSGLTALTNAQDITPENKKLHDYGNNVGNVVQQYENGHTNQAAILTDYAQDRMSEQKSEAMRQLGTDLVMVGDAISALSSAPAELGTKGEDLASAYRDIGTKLSHIPDQKADADFVKAILAYNAAAEGFAKKYVSLALAFQTYGISFAKDEPGSVFMMPAGTSF